jgi:DNA-binding LacI/PurR family transcriptional regulator
MTKSNIVHQFDPNEHVYIQVADLLRNEILLNNVIGKIPGIRDLAKQYSVNFKTANKAISVLVQEGLLVRLKGRGTFVVDNQVREMPLVGVLLPDVVNPYFANLAQEIQVQGHNSLLSVIINTIGIDIERLMNVLAVYKSRNVAAIIVQGGVVRKSGFLEHILDAGIPIVGNHLKNKALDDVWLDFRSGAKIVTSHLIETLGSPVGYVSGSDEPVDSTSRYAGYCDAHQNFNLRVKKGLLASDSPTYRGGFEGTKRILSSRQLPKSILYYNQIMAMGGENAIGKLGYSIPADIGVASFDDTITTEEMITPTTTLAFPIVDTAKSLINLVKRRLKQSDCDPMDVCIRPKLVVRTSTQQHSSK